MGPDLVSFHAQRYHQHVYAPEGDSHGSVSVMAAICQCNTLNPAELESVSQHHVRNQLLVPLSITQNLKAPTIVCQRRYRP